MPNFKTWPGKAPQRVVCAACRSNYNHAVLVLGPRHWDETMRDVMNRLMMSITPEWEQGFIDQFGDFLTRQEAWVIANEQGQIIRRCGGDSTNGGTLYSENLY